MSKICHHNEKPSATGLFTKGQKDKIWLRTDKLQRCRRLPLEGVLIRKWFDRWYVAESLCYRLLCKINHVLISQQHESRRGRPIFFRTNIYNIHQDGSILCQALTCLIMEEIPAHLLRPRVLTRCQNPSSSAKIAQRWHINPIIFFAPWILVSREQEGSGQME